SPRPPPRGGGDRPPGRRAPPPGTGPAGPHDWSGPACVSEVGRGTTSRSSSSITGSAAFHTLGRLRSPVSEWAPHPWSRLTTLPSSGDHSLAHTPKRRRSDPASGRKKAQVEHCALAARA